jgi:raffinose/stachyose/melibiose transport system permease protein
MMKKQKKADRVIEFLLWAGALIVIVPIVFIIINSLKSAPEIAGELTISLPKSLHFENYIEVIKGGKLFQSFFNSFIYSIGSVMLTCILAAFAAFVIVRRNTKYNKIIFYFFLMGMIAPSNIVTMFKVMNGLKLINTYSGMIMIYIGVFLPFSIYLYNGFIKGIPKELDESAMIDGAGAITLFMKIIFPLLKPVTVTIFVLNFAACWNDFYYPLYFTTSSQKWGVVLLLYQYTGQYIMEKNLLFAAATIIILPTLIVYIFGQKYIIDGMTAGAVKG